jgi:hypothetical protein
MVPSQADWRFAVSAGAGCGLSRHWRNDALTWKYHHVGNSLLNDALPDHGQI